MRRGACLLALLGLTVQNAMGADDFRGTARLNPSSSSQVGGSSGTATPQKFSRSPSTKEGDLKNYYKELFGENEAPVAPASATRTDPLAMKPAVQEAGSRVVKPAAPVTPVAGTASLPGAAGEKEIIHAEYRGALNANGSIEQIAGERFSARPFPGLGGAPAEAGPRTADLSGQAVISPEQTAPPTGKGTVTFSKGNGNAAPPARNSNLPFSTSSAARASATTPRTEMRNATSMATAAPSVKVEWQKQTDINVGQECVCQLLVSNVGQTIARDVEVRASFPTSVRLVNAEPSPSQAEKFLGWAFNELKPGETKTIAVTMIPMERGDINTRADVRFSGTAEGLFAVAEPMLDIHVEGPQQVLIGEPASHLVTVSNPGTGIANRVQIEAVLPAGLEHARGQRLLMDLGNLNPGESRSVRLALAATKGGPQQLEVQAKSETGLVRSANSQVTVISPMLAAAVQGPSLRYVGRQGVYTLTVTNDGAAATDNVQVRYKIPDGFEFVSSDRGAQFDAGTGLLTWFVGRLERGQKSEIRTTLMARQLGEFKHLVRATSEHGTFSDAECVTSVEGTSSLSIAVKDTEDPVEVGSQTTYEIRVKNEGSASARKVGLSCELPAGMSFITAEGPSEFTTEGATVLFRTLPEVAAGQTMTFKVKVAAGSPGSLRFRALLSSESVEEPIAVEELTKFYGER